MSDNEVKSSSEGCRRTGSCFLYAGIGVMTFLLVVVAVLLVPVSRDAANRVDVIKAQTTEAALYVASGDKAFLENRFEEAAMDYMVAASVKPSDVAISRLVSRARVAGIAANPSAIESVNALEIRNDARIVAEKFPSDMTNVKIVQAMLKVRESLIPEAIAMLDEAAKADPQNGFVRLAQAVVWQFDPVKATMVAGELEAALAARPDDLAVVGIAGQYYLNSATPDKGVLLLKKASEKKRNLAWLKVVSQAELQKGDKEAALADLQVAYALAPRDAEVLGLFGQALLNNSDFAKAAEVLEAAVSIRETREAAFSLAVALNALKKYERSLPILSKLVQADSDLFSMFEFANALSGSGRVDQALKIYNNILALDERNAGVPANIIAAIKDRAREAIAATGILPQPTK